MEEDGLESVGGGCERESEEKKNAQRTTTSKAPRVLSARRRRY